MDHWEDQIWAFGELTAESQARVEAYVAAHPSWLAMLQAAKRMHAVLVHAGRFDGVPTGQDVLAYYVATEHYSAERPPGWAEWGQKVERAIRDDPEVQARYETLQAELHRRLASSSVDHVARFERLTGHRLESSELPNTKD